MKNSKSGHELSQELQVILTIVSLPGLNAATANLILKNKVVFIDIRASLDFFAFLHRQTNFKTSLRFSPFDVPSKY